MRDGDNNTEVLVQYFKLVTFHDRPPLYDTPHPPIVLMTSCDVTWCHWCDVALPPLHSWTLILWLHWWHLIVIYLSSWGGRLHLIVLLHLMAPYNRGHLQSLQPLLWNWPFSLPVCICLWSAEKSKFSSYAPCHKITIKCHHFFLHRQI